MVYDYKVEPVPEITNKLVNTKSSVLRGAEMIQKVLETESKSGWEFVDIKTINVPIKRTFLRSAKESTISLIFFRRLKSKESLSMGKNSQSERPFGQGQTPSLGPAVKG